MAVNPYEEGCRAAQRSDTRRCPYDAQSIKARRWWSGYHHAETSRERPPLQPTAPPALAIDDYTQLTLFGGAAS